MKLISQLQAAGQDHEFYPTTHEILNALFRHHFREDDEPGEARFHGSVLDIGAGNGKVLDAFAKRGADTLYAIEKSAILQRELPARVLIIGTEFAEQSLHSKPVDLLFCNPPYSQFIGWMVKIIRTAAAKELYLVVPRRWQDNAEVLDALHFRGVFLPDEKDPKEPPPEPAEDATEEEVEAYWQSVKHQTSRHGDRWVIYTPPPRVTIVGEFDFEDAEDRQARAKVHLLHIPLQISGSRDENTDAFERFFEEQFADLIARFKGQKEKPKSWEQPPAPTDRFPLVTGESYVEALVSCYYVEFAKIEKNYNAVATLDADLLREFEVYPAKIMALLKQRLEGLRHDYWHELFDRMDKLTSPCPQTPACCSRPEIRQNSQSGHFRLISPFYPQNLEKPPVPQKRKNPVLAFSSLQPSMTAWNARKHGLPASECNGDTLSALSSPLKTHVGPPIPRSPEPKPPMQPMQP